MNCKDCDCEVEPAIEETFAEAVEILRELGKEADLKPTCGNCLMRAFGEVQVH